MSDTVRIKLPYTELPLSLNHRMHWAKQSRITKDVRLDGYFLTRKYFKRATHQHLIVELELIVPDKRRRDTDNPVATLKALCDGIVDAGTVPDDTPEYMTKLPVKITPQPGVREFWLNITPRT